MKKWAILLALTGLVLAGCSNNASGTGKDGKPKKIILDYAYYSPVSLVLKDQGLAEKKFKEEGIDVEFVLSQGSNKALEFLSSDSVDFGSAAGAAALLAKEKGTPIQTVYISSKPEWTALLAKKGSIQSVADLKGKKVAATLGTDPYIFLLRALKEAGLSEKDVEIVNLQHSDGAAAVQSGDVDAWAGLDPHMAKVELESDIQIFYRNPDFNSFSTLDVREEFAKKYPEYVEKVLEAYEEARQWTIDHPDETAEILAKEASISIEVAKKQLERTDYSNPVPGDEQNSIITGSGEVLKEAGLLKESTDVSKLTTELLNPTYADKVTK
ncbi:aliphatic sulfonate ABC transporter substrate-binding protein [Peribacillus psychrosaccharolyticus]|uniref:Putative aliphatic sulfonates-binding protein n=1 Tax=Peribacillus psychrosaccharolyticus TaxID=1407 RepID=A0A974NM27_PERPY|nr:aliphatic sulfonate ABC transporter substrate-binding protein [Peribacillus psychrosaccharolyticus]MEC2056437.1 aliphatic sulfonate ABC transporter substrate-binding protein [Peribacillus psychrosaccharolyticus]MED3745427.1 aliphatic sulfonate ABC transporter substrate-binding protein [Peribacillus psychrosaccharolyticus]QQT00407.1 aliphatic sulfonate ABC transporter substrate-binding protein [Peribacillus psychrosaccharolyticus]